ncbi:MAG: helix-turn-helix transcriptional regulator [Prevotella sp.]|nr:helix-turn-helix transcriptional regulator [Prevotella sp.]
MSCLKKLNQLLKSQSFNGGTIDVSQLLDYAKNISQIENVTVVVSDMRCGISRIFPGKFGIVLGVSNYVEENSIWEKAILNLMTEKQREEKYLAELRFFNFLRHVPRHARPDYYLVSKLRMKAATGDTIDVIHRMYYIYADDSETVTHALCLYGRPTFDFIGKNRIVNSFTGVSEELTASGDSSILSRREKQVLTLIDSGKRSYEIADILSISKNTVNRHRQQILAKLQVKNSMEACRIAKTMKII